MNSKFAFARSYQIAVPTSVYVGPGETNCSKDRVMEAFFKIKDIRLKIVFNGYNTNFMTSIGLMLVAI